MKIHNRTSREPAYFGMPWESAYGYAQAVRGRRGDLRLRAVEPR